MVKSEVRHPDKAAHTGSYSAGVLMDGWLYVSGQGPLDLKTGATISGSIEEETHLTMSHIGKILDSAGCSFDEVGN